jgi:mersacidin/lichenicidin family type 2 lantibiotic
MESRKLTRAEILRALKDADFRATLTKEQRAQLVETPLCVAEGGDKVLMQRVADWSRR